MILIPITELTDGMTTARPIFTHDHKLLLKKGAALTGDIIRMLGRRRIGAVYIEEAGTEDIAPNDLIDPALRVHCHQVMSEAMMGFQNHADARNMSIKHEAIRDATYDIVEQILSSRNIVASIIDMKDWHNRMFQHSVNTAVLSALLAAKMGHKEDECKQLAMGMMFHDCGLMLLPRDVVEKAGRLTDEELNLLRGHARSGFQRMMQQGLLSPMSAYVVLRHHERMDGEGYPDRIPGKDIHPLARIGAVVEAFDAMTSLRSYGRAMMPDQAMRSILKQAGTAFDPGAVMALLKHVAIYPTGSAVRLDTGERGIVVDTPPGQTTRPTIRLFFDAKDRRMPLVDIDLSRELDRRIAISGMSLDQVKRSHKRYVS